MNIYQLLLTALMLLQAASAPGVPPELRDQAILVANQAIAIAVEDGVAEARKRPSKELEGEIGTGISTSTPEAILEPVKVPLYVPEKNTCKPAHGTRPVTCP